MPKYPFEVSFDEIYTNAEPYVDAVFSCLESEFLIMPKGEGFIEYAVFERGYEALKAATKGFSQIDTQGVCSVVLAEPISLIVLRAMLGFTPPEWGYITTQLTGVKVSQGFARSIDRKIRRSPESPIYANGLFTERLKALITSACQLISEGMPQVQEKFLHRLNKADTRQGTDSLKNISQMGAPYAMLLYERFLGRPFAGHRDSVSELVGESLESAIEDVLTNAGISYRKTKRAERIEGFDQVPDFIVPSEFNPQVIIEAKITEDDGTARDKVTRIQHLGHLSLVGRSDDNPRFEVIACIDGRGFGVRREDMKKMLLATRGKVFTLKTLSQMIDFTSLKNFRSK